MKASIKVERADDFCATIRDVSDEPFYSPNDKPPLRVARPDSPGVRFPPPILYAAAVVGGVVVDRQWSLPIGFDVTRRLLACFLIAGWAALTASGVRSFWQRHTSVVPIRPATALVITGPYRFTRNPMYLGLALLTAAFGLFLNTWWPILLLVPTLIIVQRWVIAREERYLHRRFGADYDGYVRQVRRWL
jgi:protein-S-isoprenylcysteine O-methyltransferase Ste14